MEKISTRKPGLNACFPALFQVCTCWLCPTLNGIIEKTALESIICPELGIEFGLLENLPNGNCTPFTMTRTSGRRTLDVEEGVLRETGKNNSLEWGKTERKHALPVPYVILNSAWDNTFCACWRNVSQVPHTHGKEPRTSVPEIICFKGLINAFPASQYITDVHTFASKVTDEAH